MSFIKFHTRKLKSMHQKIVKNVKEYLTDAKIYILHRSVPFRDTLKISVIVFC